MEIQGTLDAKKVNKLHEILSYAPPLERSDAWVLAIYRDLMWLARKVERMQAAKKE